MNFARRLGTVLSELYDGPRITGMRFLPYNSGKYVAEATYQDGLVEVIFEFDPDQVSFAQQELVGLTKQEALWLKDRKTDQSIGIEKPA